jgi:hypothetical protein
MSELLEKLHTLAPFLNQLRPNPDAEPFYDWLSGGLLWTDEIPDMSKVSPPVFAALRGVLWYRTALIFGEPKNQDKALSSQMEALFGSFSAEAKANHNEALWLKGQQLFPDWPGFAPARRSVELRQRCIELKSKADRQMDELLPPTST